MKKILLQVLRYFLRLPAAYKAVEFLYQQSQAALKQKAERSFLKKLASGEFTQVSCGPFAGMIYPHTHTGTGSALAPKILGSYESELHGVMETICNKGYSQIIDIGAAEGYYTVGLALRAPSAIVNVFETDATSVELCRRMSLANQVHSRIRYFGECTAEGLARFQLKIDEKVFLLCDCEGCEMDILDPCDVPLLARCDLLVEVHDLNPDASSAFEILSSKFEHTHKITPINIKKRNTKTYLELKAFSEIESKTLLDERRIYSVGWLFMEAKTPIL
jgi:hypothetical protein